MNKKHNADGAIVYEQDLIGASDLKCNPSDNFFVWENGMGEDMSYSNAGGFISKFLKNRKDANAARLANKNLEAQAQLQSSKNLAGLANQQQDPALAALAGSLSK